jgi:hypothetical protein
MCGLPASTLTNPIIGSGVLQKWGTRDAKTEGQLEGQCARLGRHGRRSGPRTSMRVRRKSGVVPIGHASAAGVTGPNER